MSEWCCPTDLCDWSRLSRLSCIGQKNQKGNRLIDKTTWTLNKYASVATITTVFHSERIQLGETSGMCPYDVCGQKSHTVK